MRGAHLVFLALSFGDAFIVPSISRRKGPVIRHEKSRSPLGSKASTKLAERKNDRSILLDVRDKVGTTQESQAMTPEVISNSDVDTSFPKDFIPTFVLCWFVALLSSLDRVAMSVAILPLSAEYHLTDTIKGAISSVFSIGYGLAIIPCGLLAASASPRTLMGIGVIMWSLATFGTPIVASLIEVTQSNVDTLEPEVIAATTAFVVANTAPLLLTRAVMGGAESVVLPATQRLLANWVPASRKSISVATLFSGFQLGTVSAYLVSPWVIDNLGGWRGLFYVYGAIGALWLVPWAIYSKDAPEKQLLEVDEASTSNKPFLFQSKPEDKSGLTVDTQGLLKGEKSASAWEEAVGVIKDAPWGPFTKSKAVWAMIVAHAANNWGLYNMLAWTPTFYAEQYQLNVKESAFLSVFPSIAGAICGLSAGFIADKIISSFEADDIDNVKTNVRKAFQAMALLGPAACLITLSSHIPEDPLTAQALLMGTVGLQAFNAAGYGSAPQEKAGERWSGLVYSVTTLPGVVFGSLGVYTTGQILDLTGQDWSQVFSLNAGIDIIGALAFITLYNSKKEFD